MNVRFCFAKYGRMKFIGHLDLMRFFQKAVRRACLDVVYSRGFHPHQIMSFASPLSVSLTADHEYMDLEVNGALSMEEMLTRMNEVMPEGFFIRSVRELPLPANGRKRETAMSLVTAADYLLSKKDSSPFPLTSEELLTSFQSFLAREEIPVEKEVKKSGRFETIDLKKYIYGYGQSAEDLQLRFGAASIDNPEGLPFASTEAQSFATVYPDGRTFALRLCAGSEINIKPELVFATFLSSLSIPFLPEVWQVHRVHLYTGSVDALKFL